MKELLLRHNISMLQQANLLLETVKSKTVAEELDSYKDWIIRELVSLKTRMNSNIILLRKNIPELYPEILSETELLSQHLGFFNSSFVPPIHRSIESDAIGLKLLHWLHKNHTETRSIPFAISDGSFSIYPDIPTLYYLPIVEQKGLLFLALFFHEFGHLLFAIHRPEMEKLVDEVQLAIEDCLRPAFIHNDEKNEEEWRKNEIIVLTWYKWAQEIYCDAVGLILGGPSFLLAFSNYFQMGGRDEFFVPEEKLSGRSHPVTAIRMKFLIERAKRLGYTETVNKVEQEWNLLNESYAIKEEYYGYFIDDYFETISKVIDDMLVQSCLTEYNPELNSPARLINNAWAKFYEDQAGYPKWESEQVALYLSSADISATTQLS